MRRSDLLRCAAVALLVVQAGLVLALPSAAFYSGDEGIVWLRTESLRRAWWMSFDLPAPGGEMDPDGSFLPPPLTPAPGGATTPDAVALPMLSSLPYLLAGTRALHLLPVLSTVLCLLAAARLAQLALPESQDPRGTWSALAGFGAVFATPVVFYGATILEHAPAAALVTAAILPLARTMATSGGVPQQAAAVSGLLLGIAAWMRPEAILMFPAILVGAATVLGLSRAARLAPVMAAAGAIVLLPRAWLLHGATGSWLPPGTAWPGMTEATWDQAASLLLPAAARPLFALILIGTCLCALPGARRLLASPGRGRWAAVAGAAATLLVLAAGPGATAAMALSGPRLSVSTAGMASLAQAVPVVALAPLILLIPAGALSRPARLLVWTSLVYTGLVALLVPIPAGLSWGPRMLLPVAPLIVISVVAAVAGRRNRPGGRLAVTGLCVALAAGLAIQTVGLRYLVGATTSHAAIARRVERAVPEGDAILTDLPVAAQMLMPLSLTRPLLYVRPGSDLEPLLSRLDEAGVAPFWITAEKGEAPAFAGLSRGHETRLGGGLRLLRFQQEAGVRGFARLPKGD